ncbi:MAG: trypsin-like peptidase domain-containing protein [Sphingomonadales bacterium]|nr:trypsin-like peptidase domain-containing protein [Sphingomonadales bacterium]MDE2569631.1 trypsin-like peptidase domain-containing protein [Sphingomonadales bacterium]
MIRLFASLLLAFAALFVTPARAEPSDIAAAARSVVRIVLLQSDGSHTRLIGHGSGFAVSPTLVVTNAHVVERMREDDTMIVGIVPPEGRKGYLAKLVAFSPRNDLALLQLAEPGSIPAATLFSGAVGDSAQVFAVGYPGNVDLAQGLSMADLVDPQTPVKTLGYVSAGRSAKGFDTILHTAPIGTGNSGGPLLDACGRVVGVNSFGTVSDNGTDSSFFFAVSMRELIPFLRQAGAESHATDVPCQSLAAYQDEQDRRALDAEAKNAADSAARAEAQQRSTEQALHQAEMDVLTERDNGLALAALLLAAAVVAGAGALTCATRERERQTKIAGGAGVALLVGAVVVWLVRPPLSSIDERAKDLLATPAASPSPSASASASDGTGKMACVFDPQLSRVTVSDITDVPLAFADNGCVNGRTQYGLDANGWSRVLVPSSEETVSVNSYDPTTRTYTVERYLLDLGTMTQARDARGKFSPPQCGVDEATARQLGAAQDAIKAMLPPRPQERLVYHCSAQP